MNAPSTRDDRKIVCGEDRPSARRERRNSAKPRTDDEAFDLFIDAAERCLADLAEAREARNRQAKEALSHDRS